MSNFFLGVILIITGGLILYWYQNIVFAIVLFVIAIVFCDIGKAVHEGVEYAIGRYKQPKEMSG